MKFIKYFFRGLFFAVVIILLGFLMWSTVVVLNSDQVAGFSDSLFALCGGAVWIVVIFIVGTILTALLAMFLDWAFDDC